MFQLDWKDNKGWRQSCPGQPAIPPVPDKYVLACSPLLWEEHCVECSAPQCYTSCRLYADRGDGNCRRFSYGIVPNRAFKGLFHFGADIRFKRWGKLEAVWPACPDMHPVDRIRWIARIMDLLGRANAWMVRILPKRSKASLRAQYAIRLVKSFIREKLEDMASPGCVPDGLYIKLYSPDPDGCNLQLELIQDVPVFRTSLNIHHGWNEFLVPYSSLSHTAGMDRYLRLWMDKDQEARLVFTWLDLVKFAQEPAGKVEKPAEKVKCVAWDLDNTLWNGVIGDDGKDGVTLDPVMAALIRDLDKRGIVQTIASKNEHELAWAKVVELGLADYFLYPAINWNPKSANISMVAKELNINVNTFALIDDSGFERGEVASALPQVRVYDPECMGALLDRPEFDVPVTAEAATRRLKYKEEIQRKSQQQRWEGDLDGFLRDCSITLGIRPLREPSQKERCLELLHRSNQFHLSGKRYSTSEFDELLRNPERECYALDVKDRYGDYGIVGFVSIHHAGSVVHVTDFVMSCRVAKKKVEHAFFHWLLNHKDHLTDMVVANMAVTGRNQPLRQVFVELMFEVAEESENRVLWQADAGKIRRMTPPVTINHQESE